MRKEFLIETRAVTDEKGNLLNLKYYLIEEEAPQPAAPLYRICVKKSLSSRPGVEEVETIRISIGGSGKHPSCLRLGRRRAADAPPAYYKRGHSGMPSGDRR